MEASIAQNNINNWQSCDISQLVNHFHEMREVTGDLQQVRQQAAALTEDALGVLKTGNIDAITIHMALNKKESENGVISFEPVVDVMRPDDSTVFGAFVPAEDDVPYSELVSYTFKDMVTRNWLLTDAAGVDDLFVAHESKPEKSNRPELQRLLRYHINEKTNDLLFKVLTMEEVGKRLKGVILHLGADHNKLQNRSEFTFTPVIELRTEKLSDKTLLAIAKLGLRSSVGINASGDDGLLFEYMKPCPSTCN